MGYHQRHFFCGFRALAVCLLPCSALGQAGILEYQVCMDQSASADVRIFSCSKVLGDASQPPAIRAQAYANRGLARGLSFRPTSIEDAKRTRPIIYGEALADFDESLRLDPHQPNVYSLRAGAKEALEDFHGAINDYTEAMRLKPNQPWDYYARGNLLIRAKRLDEAKKDFEQCIALSPNGDASGLAKKRLESLGTK